MLDVRADSPCGVGVEDDLVIFFVKPECSWVEERLVVPRGGDVPDPGLLQEGADPIIILREVRPALKRNSFRLQINKM